MIGLNDKVTRGFKHPQSARLICPVSWLEDFDQDPEFHQKLADGKRIPHPHDWPLLLFDEATFNITNLCASQHDSVPGNKSTRRTQCIFREGGFGFSILML
ncbi:hypothetical protein JB92DRAFT_1514945 [Gautieria morchelliformis]|nr:hypothetical protein JB92DRAFT_1514945 [Gautieria morchelliformis]